MSLDGWQALGIVCGAALAALALAGLTLRGIRYMWSRGAKLSWWLDQLMGEPADGDKPATPGLLARLSSIENRLTGIEKAQSEQGARLADHVEWHGDPGSGPAKREGPQQTNGGSRRGRRVL